MLSPEQVQAARQGLGIKPSNPVNSQPQNMSGQDLANHYLSLSKPQQSIPTPGANPISRVGNTIMGNTSPDQGALFSTSSDQANNPGTGASIAAKTAANVVPDFVRTSIGFPVAVAGQATEVGKEASGLVKDSGGLVPAIKNYLSVVTDPKPYIDTLKAIIPSAAQKIAKGDFTGAAQDIANHPFQQIAPWLALLEGGAKAVGKGDEFNQGMTKVSDAVTEPIKAVGKNMSQGVKNIGEDVQKLAGLKSTGSDEAIINDYNKAIKPSVAGKGTSGQIDTYNKNVVSGVRRIAQNESNLEFVRDGETVKGGTPESPKEMADAITQTKQKIYAEYNARQKMAGLAGAKVDLTPVAGELSRIASDPVMQDVSPSIAKYAEQQSKSFQQRGTYTTDQAQQAVELYNKSLEAFYRNPSYETASRAAVDSMIANKMRSSLDSVIENAHEGTQAGESYQDLKKQYGALKAIEKDVAKRAVVAGRASPHGLFDISNIASGAELVKALGTLSPTDFATSAAIKGISEFMKWRNNPDTIIKRMFQGVKSASAEPISTVPKAGASIADVSRLKGENADIAKAIQDHLKSVSEFGDHNTLTNAHEKLLDGKSLTAKEKDTVETIIRGKNSDFAGFGDPTPKFTQTSLKDMGKKATYTKAKTGRFTGSKSRT